MSLRSMTGYGRGVGRAGGITVDVEISSVNRKQIDVQCVLPRSLQVLESRIVDELSEGIHRGRLVLNVRPRTGPKNRAHEVRVHASLAEAYIVALRQAGHRLGLPDDLKISALTAWPEILEVVHREDDASSVWPAVQAGVRQALGALLKMRETEGRILARELQRRVGRLRATQRRIAARAPQAIARHQKAMKSRLREAGVSLGSADDRLLKEIAFYADRSDIAEELVRLESHLMQFDSGLKAIGSQGRSLDFLAQELQREINTISSKAGDSGILKDCIAFKAELERLREQVQNIE